MVASLPPVVSPQHETSWRVDRHFIHLSEIKASDAAFQNCMLGIHCLVGSSAPPNACPCADSRQSMLHWITPGKLCSLGFSQLIEQRLKNGFGACCRFRSKLLAPAWQHDHPLAICLVACLPVDAMTPPLSLEIKGKWYLRYMEAYRFQSNLFVLVHNGF